MQKRDVVGSLGMSLFEFHHRADIHIGVAALGLHLVRLLDADMFHTHGPMLHRRRPLAVPIAVDGADE